MRAHLPGLFHSLLGSLFTLLLGWLVILVTGCLKMDAVCLTGRAVFRSGLPCGHGMGQVLRVPSCQRSCAQGFRVPLPSSTSGPENALCPGLGDVLPLVSLAGGCGHTPAPSCLMAPFSAEHGPAPLATSVLQLGPRDKVHEHLFIGDL